MRAVYRNPKELATAVKDLVDLYQDDLMTYEKLSEKIKRISESNEERFFKNGKLDNKLAMVLGEERSKIINEILSIFALIVLLSKSTIKAIKTLIKSYIINENMLISISCVGAFLIGKEMEGLMVIFLYQIGKILENLALNNSRKSISNLMDIKTDYACVLRNNEQVIVIYS